MWGQSTVVLSAAPVEESAKIQLDVIIDFDVVAGNEVGMEILDASHRVKNSSAKEFVVLAS